MSLYFSVAVWASLALCVCYAFADDLPRYRNDTATASWSSNGPDRPDLVTTSGIERPR